MDSSSSPSGSSAYFESLMRAGQQSMKQFDDALASAIGVEGKPATRDASSPFAVAANLQRQCWSETLVSGKASSSTHLQGRPAVAPRWRVQDEAWHHSPYYKLIEQYCRRRQRYAEMAVARPKAHPEIANPGADCCPLSGHVPDLFALC